jgi:hypothetical protein
MAAAGANFVPWPVALVLGALSAGAGMTGTVGWERHRTRRQVRRDWERVTGPGPTDDPVADIDSVLAALNPDWRIVRFSQLREPQVRDVVQWCTAPAEHRVWLVTGAAGCGKTRLILEVVDRLDASWVVGWVRRGHGATAVEVASQWRRPVVLVADDADTHPDLPAMLGAVYDSDLVRVVVACRSDAWWSTLRGSLEAHVDAALPAQPQTVLDSLVTISAAPQRFNQAVRAYARAWDAAPPALQLTPLMRPVELVVLHAAAAVAVHDGHSGPIAVDTALQRLFTIEEAWWQTRAADDRLPALGLPVLRAAVVAAVLLGAQDADDAVRVLRHLPGLSTVTDQVLRDVASWLRRLYPTRAGSWLDPYLPGRLVEHYIAHHLATTPALAAAIAAAALPPPN